MARLLLVPLLFISTFGISIHAEEHAQDKVKTQRAVLQEKTPSVSDLKDTNRFTPVSCFADYCTYKDIVTGEVWAHYHDGDRVAKADDSAEKAQQMLANPLELGAVGQKAEQKASQEPSPSYVNIGSEHELEEALKKETRDKVVVLVTNLESCPPCKEEVPYLEALLKLKGDEVAIYKVDASKIVNGRSNPQIQSLVTKYANGGWPNGSLFVRSKTTGAMTRATYAQNGKSYYYTGKITINWMRDRVKEAGGLQALGPYNQAELLRKWQAKGN